MIPSPFSVQLPYLLSIVFRRPYFVSVFISCSQSCVFSCLSSAVFLYVCNLCQSCSLFSVSVFISSFLLVLLSVFVSIFLSIFPSSISISFICCRSSFVVRMSNLFFSFVVNRLSLVVFLQLSFFTFVICVNFVPCFSRLTLFLVFCPLFCRFLILFFFLFSRLLYLSPLFVVNRLSSFVFRICLPHLYSIVCLCFSLFSCLSLRL